MVTVWIPSLLRDFTNGKSSLEVNGETVGQLIDHIEDRYPGFKDAICEGDNVIADLNVVIDGVVSERGVKQRVKGVHEIHFLPVLAGGSC